MNIDKRKQKMEALVVFGECNYKFGGSLLIFPTQHVFILLGTTL